MADHLRVELLLGEGEGLLVDVGPVEELAVEGGDIDRIGEGGQGQDEGEQERGAQGAAAIYTDGLKGSWAALRRISIRTYTWFSWLYPMPF